MRAMAAKAAGMEDIETILGGENDITGSITSGPSYLETRGISDTTVDQMHTRKELL